MFLYFIKPIFSRVIISFLILLIQLIIVFSAGIENVLEYIQKELIKDGEILCSILKTKPGFIIPFGTEDLPGIASQI